MSNVFLDTLYVAARVLDSQLEREVNQGRPCQRRTRRDTVVVSRRAPVIERFIISQDDESFCLEICNGDILRDNVSDCFFMASRFPAFKRKFKMCYARYNNAEAAIVAAANELQVFHNTVHVNIA